MSVVESEQFPRMIPDVDSIITSLRQLATPATRDGLARFAIPADKAFGVKMPDIQKLAKQLGRNHDLADALWKTGWYEARLLAAFVEEPDRVTPAQMDRWAKDFDNWAVCDTVCFHLFDRTPHAFRKVEQWSSKKAEFHKRAAFALLASLALHDKKADDASFLKCLPMIEREATDERNFVKKALVWALRGIGGRNVALNKQVLGVVERLAATTDSTSRWIGKTTLRELKGPAATRKLAAKSGRR